MERLGFLTFTEIGLGVANVESLSRLDLNMQVQRTDHMFNFSYTKSSKEIIEKMTVKVTQLKEKVEERKTRIKKLRAEYKITDAIYIDLLEQAREAQRKNDVGRMSYSVSNAQTRGDGGGGLTEENFTIGAGVVNNLLTESDFVRSEEKEATRLELICRNLKDHENEHGKMTGHHVSEQELIYLGF